MKMNQNVITKQREKLKENEFSVNEWTNCSTVYSVDLKVLNIFLLFDIYRKDNYLGKNKCFFIFMYSFFVDKIIDFIILQKFNYYFIFF